MARQRIIRRNLGTGTERPVPHPAGTRYRRPSPAGPYRIVDGRPGPIEYAVTIGSDGTLRGYRTVPAFGSIGPTSFLGFNIWGVLADNSNSLCVIEFGPDGDTQIPGATQIGITFRPNEGGPPPETIHTWDGVERYQIIDGALAGFYALNVGQTRFARLRVVA